MIKVLLINDDGILADGLGAIYMALKDHFDVTVVAPDVQKSSVGHGITLHQPLRCSHVKKDEIFFGYGLTGTPADCVKFALREIYKNDKPDFIVSGINLGKNEGCSVFYSGTVAAAREGALNGIPSFAFSLDTFTNPVYDDAAKWTVKILEKFQNVSIPLGTFLNINIPHGNESEFQGLKFCQQGLVPIHGDFEKRYDACQKVYYWLTGEYPKSQHDDESDTYALSQKYITITPIQCDTSNMSFLTELKQMDIFHDSTI